MAVFCAPLSSSASPGIVLLLQKISHVLSLGYDITEKKENEQEKVRMQRELQQAQQMDSLGQLTGGIAHHLNNLLSIIDGYSNLALEMNR